MRFFTFSSAFWVVLTLTAVFPQLLVPNINSFPPLPSFSLLFLLSLPSIRRLSPFTHHTSHTSHFLSPLAFSEAPQHYPSFTTSSFPPLPPVLPSAENDNTRCHWYLASPPARNCSALPSLANTPLIPPRAADTFSYRPSFCNLAFFVATLQLLCLSLRCFLSVVESSTPPRQQQEKRRGEKDCSAKTDMGCYKDREKGKERLLQLIVLGGGYRRTLQSRRRRKSTPYRRCCHLSSRRLYGARFVVSDRRGRVRRGVGDVR